MECFEINRSVVLIIENWKKTRSEIFSICFEFTYFSFCLIFFIFPILTHKKQPSFMDKCLLWYLATYLHQYSEGKHIWTASSTSSIRMTMSWWDVIVRKNLKWKIQFAIIILSISHSRGLLDHSKRGKMGVFV